MLLLTDEVLRFPLQQGLIIIRGHKPLKVNKYDYTLHPESKKFRMEKTEDHVPKWHEAEVSFYDREQEYKESVYSGVNEEPVSGPEFLKLRGSTSYFKKKAEINQEKTKPQKKVKQVDNLDDLLM